MSWPEALFIKTDGTTTALVLLVIASILAVWGFSLVRSAYQERPGRW